MLKYFGILIVWASLLSLVKSGPPIINCAKSVDLYGDGLTCASAKSAGYGEFGITYKVVQDEITKLLKVQYAFLDQQGTIVNPNPAQEIKVMQACDHPNVIKFFSEKQVDKFHFMLMEIGKNGPFFDWVMKNQNKIGVANPDTVLKFFSMMVEGLMHIHSKNFVLTDLNMGNMVLDENDNIKFIDFGSAVKNGAQAPCNSGAEVYMDPAIFCEGQVIYDERSDIYSLGVALFILNNIESDMYPMTTKDKKDSANDLDLSYSAGRAKTSRSFKLKENTDALIAYLIHWMTQLMPENRPTLAQVKSEVDARLQDKTYRPIKETLLKNNVKPDKTKFVSVKGGLVKFNRVRLNVRRLARMDANQVETGLGVVSAPAAADDQFVLNAAILCAALFGFVAGVFCLTIKARQWFGRMQKASMVDENTLQAVIDSPEVAVGGCGGQKD